MFERMEDDLLLEIGLDITPKYIGNDLVLLLGLTDARAKQMMNGGKDGGASMFYSLEKWSPSLRTGFRLNLGSMLGYSASSLGYETHIEDSGCHGRDSGRGR